MSSEACAPALVIRKCCSNDAQAMTSLMRQLSYPTTLNVMKERLAMMEEQPSRCLFVAEVNGEVVGSIGVQMLHKKDMDKPVLWITSLIVDENHRMMGLGKRLIDEAQIFAYSKFCSHLFVNYKADGASGAAKTFYLKQGFECSGYRLSKVL